MDFTSGENSLQNKPIEIEPSNIYVIGSSSQLFLSLNFDFKYHKISGRLSDLDVIPLFSSDSLILIFADPPDICATKALLISILGSLSGITMKSKIIYISSISADIENGILYPYAGQYARKKRAAENFLMSSQNLNFNLNIIRVGNVFSHGGWREVSISSKFILLPSGANFVKSCDNVLLRSVIEGIFNSKNTKAICNAWCYTEIDKYFRKIIHVPGLIYLYKFNLGRIFIKVLSKVLLCFGIYIPSPDDVHSFY
jgi:hypothetical protein